MSWNVYSQEMLTMVDEVAEIYTSEDPERLARLEGQTVGLFGLAPSPRFSALIHKVVLGE
jgi:hypothetical protein